MEQQRRRYTKDLTERSQGKSPVGKLVVKSLSRDLALTEMKRDRIYSSHNKNIQRRPESREMGT